MKTTVVGVDEDRHLEPIWIHGGTRHSFIRQRLSGTVTFRLQHVSCCFSFETRKELTLSRASCWTEASR